MTARRDRPISRWISWSRPDTRRRIRSGDDPGSIEYSAVTQPLPVPRSHLGEPGVGGLPPDERGGGQREVDRQRPDQDAYEEEQIVPEVVVSDVARLVGDDRFEFFGLKHLDQRRSYQQVAKARGLPSLNIATPNDQVTDVIVRMRATDDSQLTVVGERGELQGIVSEIELLEHMLTNNHKSGEVITIEHMVNHDVRSARLDSQLDEVLHDLTAKKVVVLTDEMDRPQGILTIIDALDYLATPSNVR